VGLTANSFFPCSATTNKIEDQSAECDDQQQQQYEEIMEDEDRDIHRKIDI